uniref:SAM-dependent methyltransferase n=1 Tax=Anisakis simplex TaxID=6269 RepID=A0A0M3JPR1_ANISI
LAIFIAKPIPFVEEFLEKIENMMYPKEKIDLYVYNNQKYNEHDVSHL